MDDDPRDPLLAIERAMVALRRSIAKRTLGRRVQDTLDLDPNHLGVLDAVAFEEGPVTVGDVADKLAVDASRASRLVAAAVDAGLVRRVAAQADGRRVVLELTTAGEAVERAVAEIRRAWFAEALADFTPAEREAFAGLFRRFVDKLGEGPPRSPR